MSENNEDVIADPHPEFLKLELGLPGRFVFPGALAGRFVFPEALASRFVFPEALTSRFGSLR